MCRIRRGRRGGGGGGEVEVTEPQIVEPPDLRAMIQRMLGREGCGKFVEDLIVTVGSQTGRAAWSSSVVEIYDKVKGQGDIKFGNFTYQSNGITYRAGALAGGSVGAGNASISMSYETYLPTTKKWDQIMIFNAQSRYGRSLMHELIHHSGDTPYSDYDLAKALHTMGYISDDLFKKLSPDPNNPNDASRVWDEVLQNKCGIPYRNGQ